MRAAYQTHFIRTTVSEDDPQLVQITVFNPTIIGGNRGGLEEVSENQNAESPCTKIFHSPTENDLETISYHRPIV